MFPVELNDDAADANLAVSTFNVPVITVLPPFLKSNLLITAG